MKLLALCGFLLVFLLCLSALTVEGQKAKKICCSKLPKLSKKAHKGINSKMIAMRARKYCKPCLQPPSQFIPGPLPRFK